MLDNLALYFQNEVAILITALRTSCQDFIRETGEQHNRCINEGFFQKPGLLDDFCLFSESGKRISLVTEMTDD
jgi:hypothetical protein